RTKSHVPATFAAQPRRPRTPPSARPPHLHVVCRGVDPKNGGEARRLHGPRRRSRSRDVVPCRRRFRIHVQPRRRHRGQQLCRARRRSRTRSHHHGRQRG